MDKTDVGTREKGAHGTVGGADRQSNGQYQAGTNERDGASLPVAKNPTVHDA